MHSEEQRDDIGHLDLASGSKLDLLPDEDGKVNQTDCVLVSKNLKLEWNYDAGKLVNGKDNQTVGLDSKISWMMKAARAAAITSMTAAIGTTTPTRAPTTS